jgi:hypothetical protein
LSPDRFHIISFDIPQTDDTTLVTHTEDTVVLFSNIDHVEASLAHQHHLNLIGH